MEIKLNTEINLDKVVDQIFKYEVKEIDLDEESRPLYSNLFRWADDWGKTLSLNVDNDDIAEKLEEEIGAKYNIVKVESKYGDVCILIKNNKAYAPERIDF